MANQINLDKVDVKLAGEVKDFKPEDFMDRKEARRMGRFSQLAVAASKMAIARCRNSNGCKCYSRTCWGMDWFWNWRIRRI